MQISTQDGKLFKLTAERDEDFGLLDALSLENTVHIAGRELATQPDGSHTLIGMELLVDAGSDITLRDQAARQALRAIGQLISLGLCEATNHRHIRGLAVDPQLQEQFAPGFVQLKAVADVLADVVNEKKRLVQEVVGAHGKPSNEPTTLTPPAPGQYWPEQQGWYAGIARSEDGQSHWHLILPDATPETDFLSIWGERGRNITGASSRHNGLANTQAMAAAGCPAAIKVLALPGGMHIPSQAELQLLCATLHDKFDQRDWYWSSTQTSATIAFIQDFEYGTSYWDLKGTEYRVRAVRGLALQHFSTSAVPGIAA